MEIIISIIGFGNIGKAICSQLIPMKNFQFIINVIDANDDVQGAVLDFQHGNQLFHQHKIVFGSVELLNQSDYIFHCAGASVPKGQSRLYTCGESISITEAALKNFKPQGNPKFIIVSNPVEIIATVTQKITGLPSSSIIGTGTLLDTLRMNYYISERFPNFKSIESILIGEHGSTAFFSKQLSKINNEKATDYLDDETIDNLMKQVFDSAAKIKTTQKATIYGVSFCAIAIFEALLSDKESYFPVSTKIPDWLNKELKTDQVFLSLYSKVNSEGAFPYEKYLPNDKELLQLKKSIDSILPFMTTAYL